MNVSSITKRFSNAQKPSSMPPELVIVSVACLLGKPEECSIDTCANPWHRDCKVAGPWQGISAEEWAKRMNPN